jgi:hypothetical protein
MRKIKGKNKNTFLRDLKYHNLIRMGNKFKMLN